ncbi:MAG: hypothetical protein AAGI10_08865 [Pseudomonadota bacterium]
MFEVATNNTHREAIARAHSERAAVFAEGIAWLKSVFTKRPEFAAPVASAS